ncbi:hypothetical protein THASP1DRAFT_31368 [Thamnocephalis sphaerospora]|uniref:Uncharacterized protein n=1 Tax=Thamnocephalis sphaerospora TaxID=78915 RepID=A0A4P9XLQ5_9FUNG|nr:hypothetical protein THASP1DRAFT_31368 [Thamnocephalis sphaerospora]|eukprot:RKP06817.1 hypothetical protein THASP1DRAFT_31368 [Thamnocephalis sphaerospora]
MPLLRRLDAFWRKDRRHNGESDASVRQPKSLTQRRSHRRQNRTASLVRSDSFVARTNKRRTARVVTLQSPESPLQGLQFYTLAQHVSHAISQPPTVSQTVATKAPLSTPYASSISVMPRPAPPPGRAAESLAVGQEGSDNDWRDLMSEIARRNSVTCTGACCCNNAGTENVALLEANSRSASPPVLAAYSPDLRRQTSALNSPLSGRTYIGSVTPVSTRSYRRTPSIDGLELAEEDDDLATLYAPSPPPPPVEPEQQDHRISRGRRLLAKASHTLLRLPMRFVNNGSSTDITPLQEETADENTPARGEIDAVRPTGTRKPTKKTSLAALCGFSRDSTAKPTKPAKSHGRKKKNGRIIEEEELDAADRKWKCVDRAQQERIRSWSVLRDNVFIYKEE